MTIILGVDPGSRITGYGIIYQDGVYLQYLSSGCIRTKTVKFPNRLQLIYAGISQVINQFHPHCLAIEQVFMSKNADSALKLGQARGVAIVAATNVSLPVFEYAATKIKYIVTGNGAANKIQVKHMVRILLKLVDDLEIDATDALAIAITHCHFNKHVIPINSKN